MEKKVQVGGDIWSPQLGSVPWTIEVFVQALFSVKQIREIGPRISELTLQIVRADHKGLWSRNWILAKFSNAGDGKRKLAFRFKKGIRKRGGERHRMAKKMDQRNVTSLGDFP